MGLMNRKRARESRYESLRQTANEKRKELILATSQQTTTHIESDLPPIDQVEQFGFEVMKSVEDLHNDDEDEKDIDSSDKVESGAAEEITSNDSPESVGGT